MLKNKFEAVKNHVFAHRAKYAAGTTLAVCATVQLAQVSKVNEFLREHDLFDEYYSLPELES